MPQTAKKKMMYAILAAGLCGDFGRCVLVSEEVFKVARACIDEYWDDDSNSNSDSDSDSETGQEKELENHDYWTYLPKDVLNEFKNAFDKANEGKKYDFEDEMKWTFQGYQSLYLFIANSNYRGISFSFGQRFSDLGQLANYVSENNIYVVETTHDD